MMSLEDYNAMLETTYLLRTPEIARNLINPFHYLYTNAWQLLGLIRQWIGVQRGCRINTLS
ncbi:hypothetical protein [uncultured Paraglaciecola sp.]|uniref:hypothetical protein n=1 Tax=uncultured Paraglaciecola sp. TaxID=1765024 RepID=UPI0030DA0814